MISDSAAVTGACAGLDHPAEAADRTEATADFLS